MPNDDFGSVICEGPYPHTMLVLKEVLEANNLRNGQRLPRNEFDRICILNLEALRSMCQLRIAMSETFDLATESGEAIIPAKEAK